MQPTDRLNHGVHDNEVQLCQMPQSGEAADQEKKEKKKRLGVTHTEEVICYFVFLMSFWSFTEHTRGKQRTALS